MSGGVVVRVLTGRGSRTADREALLAVVADVTRTDPSLVRVHHHCPHCGGADHGRPVAVVDGRHRSVSLSRTPGVLALAVGPAAEPGRASGSAAAESARTAGSARPGCATTVDPSGAHPTAIGVDVERPSRVTAAELDVFTPGERERASGSGSAAVHRTACWAVKEAVLKRDGRGLRVDPVEVETVLGPITRGIGDHPAWFDGVVQPVTVLHLDDDLVLAVAAGGADVTVQDRRVRPDAD